MRPDTPAQDEGEARTSPAAALSLSPSQSDSPFGLDPRDWSRVKGGARPGPASSASSALAIALSER
jgi:hypothetical protein